MKNRVLGLAVAGAALGLSPVMVGKAPLMGKSVSPPTSPSQPVGPSPQGGIGSLLDAMRLYGGSSGMPGKLRRRGRGWSMATVKRMKRKTRNRLRAKGQFRKAVR